MQRLAVEAVTASGIEQQCTRPQGSNAGSIQQVIGRVRSLSHQWRVQADNIAGGNQVIERDKALASFTLGPGRITRQTVDAHGSESLVEPPADITDANDPHPTPGQIPALTLGQGQQTRQHVVYHRLRIAARRTGKGNVMTRQRQLVHMIRPNGASAHKLER